MSLEVTLERFIDELREIKSTTSQVEERRKLREIWPGLKTGSYATEAYDRACKILGGIPKPDLIDRLIEGLEPETAYEVDDLAKAWDTDIYCAEAYLYLCTIALALAPVGKSSYYLVEKGQYQNPILFTSATRASWAV